MKDKYTDRKEIAKAEINLFIKNPILGIGAGQGTQLNKVKYGRKIKSHDELTRLLAEHGLFGLLNILILTLTPIFLFLKSKENIFLFSFLVFWFSCPDNRDVNFVDSLWYSSHRQSPNHLRVCWSFPVVGFRPGFVSLYIGQYPATGYAPFLFYDDDFYFAGGVIYVYR